MTARSQAEDVAVVLAAAEAKRALRPATDPTNLAGWTGPVWRTYTVPSDGRHADPVQSFEAERAEYAADFYGIVRDHLGRHVAGGAA